MEHRAAFNCESVANIETSGGAVQSTSMTTRAQLQLSIEISRLVEAAEADTLIEVSV